MSDKDEVPAENEIVAEDSNVEASPATEQTTSESTNDEGQAEETQIDESAAEEPKGDTERKPSRAEQRIRELNKKVKELEQSNQPFQGFQQPPQLETNESGELTREQLDQYVAQAAGQISNQTVQQAIAQERAKNNFDHDVTTLPQQYPEIEQVPGLEEKIAQEFQAKAFKVVGLDPVTGEAQYALDPSVRLADIAKNYVEVARAAAKTSSAATAEAVEASADTNAIKPGSEVSTGKSLSDMSPEEIEAKYGFAEM